MPSIDFLVLACVNFDWLSAGMLLATLIVALATFGTVRQVKKQRETTLLPEIFVGNKDVHLYGQRFKDVYLPLIYSNEPLDQINDRTNTRSLWLDVHNVGFAVTKSIEFEWSLDLKSVLEKISAINNDGFFVIKNDRALEISVPSIGYRGAHAVTNQLRKGRINYILPSSVEKIPHRIIFPSFYFELYSIYLFTGLKMYAAENGLKKFEFNPRDFPPLNISFSYKDLDSKLHYKKFSLNFSMNVMNSPKGLTEKRRELGTISLISTEKIV